MQKSVFQTDANLLVVSFLKLGKDYEKAGLLKKIKFDACKRRG